MSTQKMHITTALNLAQKHIYVSYAGGYYVAQPHSSIEDPSGPSLAPSSTTDYHRAKAACRETRIREVVSAVTGDDEYALDCVYAQQCDGAINQDWRSDARLYCRAYRGPKA